MLKKDLEKFKRIKKELLKEGFIIEGVVGSFARGENYNDIDIVYSVDKDFLAKYGGFGSVIRINEIKESLENFLNCKVDLIAKNMMSKNPKIIPVDLKIVEAKKIMHQFKISSIPVVDNKNKLVGIVQIHQLNF